MNLNTGNRFIVFGALAAVTFLALQAQAEPPTVTKTEGKPLVFEFKDGRKVGLKYKTGQLLLNTPYTLTGNTCGANLGDQVTYYVPSELRSVVPYWISHPTKQGQFLTETDSDTGEVTNDVSTAVTTQAFSKKYDGMVGNRWAWFECKDKCEDIFPKNSEIIFWDENFEIANDQITMLKRQEVDITQITSRLQGIGYTLQGSKTVLHRPKMAFGFIGLVQPPGVAYQVMMTFNSPNILDPDDSLCQMTWEVNFTRLFTQFTGQTVQVTDPEKSKSTKFSEYLYRSVDEKHIFLNVALSADTYEQIEGEN